MQNLKSIDDIKKKPLNVVLLFGMLIFTIGTFTISTFISSEKVLIGFLIVMNIFFFFYYIIQNKKFIIYKLEIVFLLFFMYFLFNILYQSNILRDSYFDILMFFALFLFLLLVKLDLEYYKVAIKTMVIISTIYALSSLFQYFNIDLYIRLILPLFEGWQQEQIMILYNEDAYTGFTTQSAYIAGYLVYGIGILLLFYKERTRKMSRGLSIVVSLLLFIALLLTGKRSHLLFMVISLIFTFLFSTEIKKFFKQFSKITFKLIITVIIGASILKVYKPNNDTPIIGNMYERITKTIDGFISGEDITSGRTSLYDYAFKLFHDAPIFGIGWRNYRELSIGIISRNSGSHPHNTYLQLLTELGLVGFILFMIPVIYILFKTIKLLMNAESLFSFDMKWKTALQFSLFSQMFFILYSVTENSLTSYTNILMWGFSASITLSAIRIIKIKKMYNSSILDSD